MKRLRSETGRLFIVGLMFLSLCATTRAWEPNAKELDAAIATGGFAGYFESLSKPCRPSSRTPRSSVR
jgi:hypothetical protein